MRIKNLSRFIGIGLLAGLSTLAGACSDSEESTSEVDQMLEDKTVSESVTIFSWWTEGGEQSALRELIAEHGKQYPNSKVINATADFGDKARDELEDKLERSVPPDLFQANIGADQKKWVLFNDRDDSATKVESVDFLVDALDLRDKIYPELIDAASVDGSLYGIGVNIHRLNNIVYNKAVFERCEVSPPSTLGEFRTVAQTLKDCGVTPIALGNKWNWTLALLINEALFVSFAGPQGYTDFWEGNSSADNDAMLKAVDEALAWNEAGWFNADNGDITWSDAAARLRCEDEPDSASCAMAGGAEGVAAMTIMGDWAKGNMEDNGWVAGEDFGIVPFPASEGKAQAYVFTSDTFPLPKGAPNRAGAIRFLSTMMSKEAQIAFNKKKGSIPIRSDIDPAAFDVLQQQTIKDFQAHVKVPALSAMIPPRDTFTEWSPSMKEALEKGDTEVTTRYLENHYGELKR